MILQVAPEKWWLEDDPASHWEGKISGAVPVKLPEGNRSSLAKKYPSSLVLTKFNLHPILRPSHDKFMEDFYG